MTPSENHTTGRCQCGHVRFSYQAPESWACYCHCDDCRRNCAAPVVAYIGVKLDGFKWQMSDGSVEPKFYPSSPGVKRYFCDQCGSPMAFQAEVYVGEIHVYAPMLDDPTQFVPRFHVHYEEKLDWLHLADELPRYAGDAPAEESERV